MVLKSSHSPILQHPWSWDITRYVSGPSSSNLIQKLTILWAVWHPKHVHIGGLIKVYIKTYSYKKSYLFFMDNGSWDHDHKPKWLGLGRRRITNKKRQQAYKIMSSFALDWENDILCPYLWSTVNPWLHGLSLKTKFCLACNYRCM